MPLNAESLSGKRAIVLEQVEELEQLVRDL